MPDRSQALEQASVQPPVFSHPTIQGKRKLAIFPFLVERNDKVMMGFDGSLDAFKNEIIEVLDYCLKEDKIFVPTYSFYDLKNPVKKIAKQILDEKSIEQLWISNWYSVNKRPNLDILCELGTQLKVDAILTYWVYLSMNHRIVKSFLIDVKRKSISEKVDEARNASVLYGIRSSFKIYAQAVTLDILKE